MSKIDLRLLEQSLIQPNEPAAEAVVQKPRLLRERVQRTPPPPPPRMNRALRPRRRS
jgi:hypothetical protein